MNTELHLKYRPISWQEVLGQKATVLSIQKTLKTGRSRVFLFVGPSGVGKTTLARLVAAQIGCAEGNLIEISGSTNTGIDDVRELIDRLSYSTIDGSPRCVIMDECQSLSKNAWHGLLKVLEEPPLDVYWALCTTEGDRIPKQIKTRCSTYLLKPVADEDMLALLERVKEEEQLRISDQGLELIVEASGGSPRQALVYLGSCGDFKKLDSIKTVLAGVDEENAEAIELCRLLLKIAEGATIKWSAVAKLLRGLNVPAESVRLIILGYMRSVMLSGHEEKAGAAFSVASAFRTPFLDREGLTPLVLACADVWSDDDR